MTKRRLIHTHQVELIFETLKKDAERKESPAFVERSWNLSAAPYRVGEQLAEIGLAIVQRLDKLLEQGGSHGA